MTPRRRATHIHERRLGSGLGVLSLLLTLQVLCVAGWPALHFAFVQHVLCLKHGRLEHVRGSDALAKAVRWHVSPLSSVVPGEDDSDRDACGVTFLVTPYVSEKPVAATLAPSPEVEWVEASVNVADVPSSIDLLALAPKQSPPRS